MTPPSTPVASYVVDVDTGAYAQIGTGFTVSHRVTTPAFNRDGTKVAVGIASGTETAVYEATVQNPTILTRVGSVHEGRVKIGKVRYAAGDRIVYTADVRETNVYEIFVARDTVSQRLNADLGTSVFINSEAQGFTFSSDGTTVAYVQPPSPAAPRDLFLVDVTTPGLPLKTGENVSTELFYSLPYAILD